MSRLLLSFVLLPACGLFTQAADWPQWRGPDRTNVSREKGLLDAWTKEGPQLVWKAVGLGDGVAPVSVADGRVFTTGNVGEDVVCTALSKKDGKQLWATKLGPAAKESSIMRWLAQMAPTVDGNRLYAVTANGDYLCLAADTGKVIWQKHFVKDFTGKKGSWGFCDYPLVEGERLIICPGGEKNSVAALDKKTGELIWACVIPAEGASHSVVIAAQIGGVKQYVIQLSKGMHGISTEGKRLWSYAGLSNAVANTHAPISRGDEVFFANGYNTGHALLKLGKTGETWSVEEVYRAKQQPYVPWLGSPTAFGDHVLVTTFKGLNCVDWKTGNIVWTEEKLGRCMYTIADSKLFVRTQTGRMVLAEADPKEWKPLAEFTPPRPDKGLPAWTFPVVADGMLFVRDYDTLLCYDIHAPDVAKKKVPDAVFVPTPKDVVVKMLELASVKKDDVVFDLGSGDGRIVIAAAKKQGCRAKGVELDKELVEKSRELARAAGVEKLVEFECGDLFETDFKSATVVALYILPEMSRKLIPKFDRLQPGSRIVSHEFAIPGVKPDKIVKMASEEDDVERPLYLYTIPLKKDKP